MTRPDFVPVDPVEIAVDPMRLPVLTSTPPKAREIFRGSSRAWSLAQAKRDLLQQAEAAAGRPIAEERLAFVDCELRRDGWHHFTATVVALG